MIFRLYILCLLLCACADDINRVQATDTDALLAELGFGDYVLEEVEQEPTNMPAQSEAVTLKDVQIISKISATVSLLVTDKNVTWKYDEEEDTLTKITYQGSKKAYGGTNYVLSGTAEYGFSKQLVRIYAQEDRMAKLVINRDVGSNGEEFSNPIDIPEVLYDKDNPPRILYLNADRQERETASVFIISDKTFVFNSPEMGCAGEKASPVMISKVSNASTDTKSLTAGLGSDDKSFWSLNKGNFQLYIWHDCKMEEEDDGAGGKVTKPKHSYPAFVVEINGEDKSPTLQVTYKGDNATVLPLGMWINVSDKKKPTIEGKIISISKEGKLLSVEYPE